MQQTIEPQVSVRAYRLEIRDDAGRTIKTIVGDAATDSVIAHYPDGTTEHMGAFIAPAQGDMNASL